MLDDFLAGNGVHRRLLEHRSGHLRLGGEQGAGVNA